MSDNDFSNNYEGWIDSVRIQIYEEMLMLGEEKYYVQMSERVREAAEKHGFSIDRRKPAYSASRCFEEIMEVDINF